MGAYFGQPSVDAAMAALAARQHAVFGLAQLRALGLETKAAQKRAGDARLHRIHQGVYSLIPASLLRREGRYMAAVLACGPGALLSHQSAAVLHGLLRYGPARVDVTIPGRSGRARPGIAVHRSTTLKAADKTRVENIPITTVTRTLCDIAGVVPRRLLERAFDQGEIMGVLDLRAVEEQLVCHPTRPGAKEVRSILAEHYIGETLTESELEEAMLALSRRVGLPPPEVNKWIDLGDGEPMIRADFVWREQRLIVEVDGFRFHRTRQRFEADRRRDQRAMTAGWRVLRTTANQVKRRPGELHATVAALLAQAPPAGAGSPAAGGAPIPPPRSRPPAGESTSGPPIGPP
jgi:Protein of unknown function (DUF559)